MPRACYFLTLVVSYFSVTMAPRSHSLEHDVLPTLPRNVPAMLNSGDPEPAVKSGDLKGSELWKRVASDEMPGDKKLSAAEKDRAV